MYLYMYTEKSTRLQNELLPRVTSGGYDREEEKTFHLLYMIYLSIESYERYHISIFQRKEKNNLLNESYLRSSVPMILWKEGLRKTLQPWFFSYIYTEQAEGKEIEERNNSKLGRAHFHLTFTSVTATPESPRHSSALASAGRAHLVSAASPLPAPGRPAGGAQPLLPETRADERTPSSERQPCQAPSLTSAAETRASVVRLTTHKE